MLGVSPSHYASGIVNIHKQHPKLKDAGQVVLSPQIQGLYSNPSLSGDFVLLVSGRIIHALTQCIVAWEYSLLTITASSSTFSAPINSALKSYRTAMNLRRMSNWWLTMGDPPKLSKFCIHYTRNTWGIFVGNPWEFLRHHKAIHPLESRPKNPQTGSFCRHHY